MDLFNKIHVFEPMKSHIYEPDISIISLSNLMFNCAKSRIKDLLNYNRRGFFFFPRKEERAIALNLR